MNQIKKLSYLLIDPVRFFEENNDNKDELFRFALFIVRMHFAIGIISLVIFILIHAFVAEQPIKPTLSFEKLVDTIFIFIALLLFVFFVQAIAAAIIIEQFGRPIHWLVKWVTGKDDLLKAKRIAVYNTPFYALLVHEYLILLLTKSLIVLGIVFGAVIMFSFIWQTIGIAKQYQLSYKKAFFVSFLPFLILIGVFGLIFLYIGFNLGFENIF
jgi:hypothetical protein